MKKVFITILAVLIVLSLASCTGKNGSTGPAGPQQPGLYYVKIFQQGVYSSSYSGQKQSLLNTGLTSPAYTDSNSPVGIGPYGSPDIYRALFKFDISELPSSKMIVDKVELILKINSKNVYGGAQDVKVYKVTSYWDEYQVSETKRTASLSWTNSGGDFSSNTITTNSATFNFPPDSTVTIGLDPATVQGWMENSSTNYGIILISSDENYNKHSEIYSSGASTPSDRPMLKIWYYTTE